MSVNRSYSQSAYAYGARPRLSESYMHLQRVQSRFQKHGSVLQHTLHVLILFAVVFCLIQMGRAIGYDIYKLSILMNNHTTLQRYHQEALAENIQLREQIAVYSSPAGIEELARNNLEMVGPDEILVRIRG